MRKVCIGKGGIWRWWFEKGGGKSQGFAVDRGVKVVVVGLGGAGSYVRKRCGEQQTDSHTSLI